MMIPQHESRVRATKASHAATATDAGVQNCEVQNGDPAAFLSDYDPAEFPPVGMTVDLVVFAVEKKKLHVAVVERGAHPFLGSMALPGGFVGPGENALAAARRELAEETGLELLTHRVFVEQLATFTEPDRDPRMRVVSVAHLVLLASAGEGLPPLVAGTDAASAHWVPVHEVDPAHLAFDHAEILAAGLERLAGKMEYTTIATWLVPAEFTISALRDVYGAVWQLDLPAGNFTRKIRPSLTPTGGKVQGLGAPASLFTTSSEWISPPWTRPRQ
ncbi:NUDIX hydrolase [Arthrobacter sp. TMN-49]